MTHTPLEQHCMNVEPNSNMCELYGKLVCVSVLLMSFPVIGFTAQSSSSQRMRITYGDGQTQILNLHVVRKPLMLWVNYWFIQLFTLLIE